MKTYANATSKMAYRENEIENENDIGKKRKSKMIEHGGRIRYLFSLVGESGK